MSTYRRVEQFYADIWNSGDEDVARLLSPDFVFRGSLGSPTRGHAPFLDIVRAVRKAFAEYHCEILDGVTELPKAFARMSFSGLHVAPFRGFEPSGLRVTWQGAALFTFDDELISELWVLSDVASLDQQLLANADRKSQALK